MNSKYKSKRLKLLTICASAAATALRAAHYAFGMDGRSLLVTGHWAVIGLWVVSVGFALALLLMGYSIRGSGDYAAAHPASPVSAAGCFALAAGLVVTGLQQYGDFSATVDIIVWALGLLSGAGLLVAGICRLTGKKPYFPIHALLCLVFILRMITQYRHWSADPQLQDYGFYLCAHAAVMLAAYQHAAFDTGMGNVRALWISSLGAVYLCCAALPQCEEALLMGCCAIWAFTNLTVLPVRKRRVRPTFRTVQQEE